MSRQFLGEYDLFDRTSKTFVEARLHSPIIEQNIEDFRSLWRPVFEEREQQLRAEGRVSVEDFGANDLQDAHWKWIEKAQARDGRLDWESFAIEAEGQTQGLMFTRTMGFAREPTQLNKPLVMIDLLATAPWNRPKLAISPRFKGVGRIMMVAAISLSVDEEFEGRIGLHALPQAESWYRDVCGMTPIGVDKTQMQYFEMTETQARAFLDH